LHIRVQRLQHRLSGGKEMMKVFVAASAALLLGIAAASAAPIRAPALGEAIEAPTAQVAMMEHRTMHRGYMHRGYGMHPGYGMHRGYGMRHHLHRYMPRY
jgi:hypothetical protein